MFAQLDHFLFTQIDNFLIESQQFIFVFAHSEPVLNEARYDLVDAALLNRALNDV